MAGANQVMEFVGKVLTKVPWGRVNKAKLQALIDDPDRVAAELLKFIDAGGRVQVGLYPTLNLNVELFIPDGWSIHPED